MLPLPRLPFPPLKLHCGKTTASRRPQSYIGAHVWLVVPHFAEETAFAIPIAQEFHVGKTEQEFEVQLVSVCRDCSCYHAGPD